MVATWESVTFTQLSTLASQLAWVLSVKPTDWSNMP